MMRENEEIDTGGADGRIRPVPPKRQPVFNLPGVVLVLIGIFVAVHLIRTLVLDLPTDTLFILLFSFNPLSYTELAAQLPFPRSGWWSPISHGFLHGDWLHLGVNSIWMAAFGTPVARRFGNRGFLVFTLLCMGAGALAHLISHLGLFAPAIGASGAVSGHMGAAGRFAFNNMGRGTGLRHDGPALGLVQSFRNPQFLIFAGVWMVFNYLFGAGIVSLVGQEGGIAWQAHIGGFLAGVLLFSLFDPANSDA